MPTPKAPANAIVRRKADVRMRSLGRTENEADFSDGMNEHGLSGGVDLAAESAEMNVHEVGARVEAVAPNVFEQHRACQDLAGILHHEFEKNHFAWREVDSTASTPYSLSKQIKL